MNKLNELSNEQRFVILGSRLTFSSENEQVFEELAKGKLDWYKVINYSIRNRVSLLIWYNLYKRNLHTYLSTRWKEAIYFHYLGTQKRNKAFLGELKIVLQELNTNNIPCAPLKGGYLLPNVYPDLGIRTVNDMDCLVRQKDIKKLDAVMKKLGYIQGDFNPVTNKIDIISRERQLLWKTKMSNLYPYNKIYEENEYCKIMSFDFCFSLDYNLKFEPVNHIISRAVPDTKVGFVYLKPFDFFIHICCHHFKEATNPVAVVGEKEINLIKFCDVREYVLQAMKSEDLVEAVELSKEYGYEKALYFTLHYLKEIYNDGYELEMMEQLGIKDRDFLYKYGERDYEQAQTWKKSFWKRLFADSNEDELMGRPKLFDII